jgi:hypothetical protein
MVMHNSPVMVAVYGTPCAIPPRNSNSKLLSNVGQYLPVYTVQRPKGQPFPHVLIAVKTFYATGILSERS